MRLGESTLMENNRFIDVEEEEEEKSVNYDEV